MSANDDHHIAHTTPELALQVTRLGIDTSQTPVAFLPSNSPLCRSEGFSSLSRVELLRGDQHLLVTLNIVDPQWVASGAIGLSDVAWQLLQAAEGDTVYLRHPQPIDSLSQMRAKIYGHALTSNAMHSIISDIAQRHYSDIELAAFVSACSGSNLSIDETCDLTRAMVAVGDQLHWPQTLVLDKHCVGGLPGNRTTPLIVAIVSANGLCMPKTSSRAITSPSGTADTMEMLAPVMLDLAQMRRVVEQEGGCIVWGGAVNLSPADDIMIRVERALEIDSEGQLVASVLSKKIAAGATHVLIDMPLGPTAKLRDSESAEKMRWRLTEVGQRLGLQVSVQTSDGRGPVGRGVGPALEAQDVLAVFQGDKNAPDDLRTRALELAGRLLEMGGKAGTGMGYALAAQTLDSGAAWKKFQAICAAQGGLRMPPTARYHHVITAQQSGCVSAIDNRVLSRIAKLAGAPAAGAAGLTLDAHIGSIVERGEPLYCLHAESPGELAYALDYARQHPQLFVIT